MKSKIILILFFVLSVFFISCEGQQEPVKPVIVLESQIGLENRIPAKDFAPGQLETHYLKHKDEFGDITQEDYLNNARELLNSIPNKDVLEKIRANGDILHYRVSTGEFAVMARDGRIRTYFKADYRYWLRQ